ncbi:PstS family phosphate ABC transporter substrate-binding protein [Yoonia vestfoldensis]|uniref:PstS family phosphate ABC transporter substrate-binding protein n=1 Tax=Yoonia vestfoldensis TaxID=245188 RepID=UPI0003758C2E|nr:substrate-binding domain-containing protein [Yoonia vestfoldensis]
MTLLKSLTTALICSVAPTVLTAQVVELRSSDNFISVEGEIIGFNGTMVTIQSTVGPVSVPASGVVCYGAGCTETLATNTFGLTADDFAGVVDETQADSAAAADILSISFGVPSYEAAYRSLSGAFAVAGKTDTSVEIDGAGTLTLADAAGDAQATLSIAAPDQDGDIALVTTSLAGSAEQEYVGPSGWALAAAPRQQMIGLRAFAVVTATDVGVDAITMDDLAGIYAGEITNWAQIGGADLTVLPLQLPMTSEVRDEFIAVVMAPAGKAIADNVLTMADEASIAAAISGFAGSISVVNVGNAGSARVLPVAGPCGIAVAPTDFNIVSGDYPLVGPVVARFDMPAATSLPAEVFDFATSKAVQDLLARDSFIVHAARVQAPVDRNIRLTALLTANPAPEERPVAARMFQTLSEAERLTPTMSGGPASGAEGAWNRAMMHNLATVLAQPEYAGRQVIFAGFGDSEAGALDAVDRSAGAAAAMAAAFSAFAPTVLAANGLTVTSTGFGGVSRTTCYEGHVAGPAHSRIEVWVK